MNESLSGLLLFAPLALGAALLVLFIAIPFLLRRILEQLKAMNESLDVMRHNSIKADRRAEQ